MNATDKQRPTSYEAMVNVPVLNIKELLHKYWHYKWLFALLVGLALTGAWLYLRYTTPRYNVSATMLIRPDNVRGGGTGENAFADLLLYKESINKQNEIQILQSRSMMARVVKALGLQSYYYVVGNVKTTNIYRDAPFVVQFIPPFNDQRTVNLKLHFTDLNKFRLGEAQREYTLGEIITLPSGKVRIVAKESIYSDFSYKDFIYQYRPLEQIANAIRGGLQVKPVDDRSHMLQLSYITENPQLGADIINTLMAEYNEAAVEDKNEINRRILSFIDDRLTFVEVQLDSVEREMQQYRTRHQVINLEAQSEQFFTNSSKLGENIREQQIQIQVVEILENYLSNPGNVRRLVPSTLGITDPTLLALTEGYNKLVIERDLQLQAGATEFNPGIENIDKNIEEARQKLLLNLTNIKATYRGALNMFESQNRVLQGQIGSIPSKEQQTRERARQQEIKQNLYLYLLQKKEESAIAQASTIANARVVDEALNSASQVSPNRNRVIMLAIIAGLLLPLLIIYLIDMLNDKVTVKADVMKVTDAPIISEVGHSGQKEVLIFPQKSRSIIAEQLRTLRSNLQFLRGDSKQKPVIMVTSSFSGEGKSFISTNLGATLAIAGYRTVILEFDLRKPKIVRGLGLEKGNGITNYLVGAATLEQLPQPVNQVENLYIIPCGPVPPNPAEILLLPKVAELFNWLQLNFDAVVIDTAPVGLVGDAFSISKFANMTLYVIRQRYTYKKQVHAINDLYREKRLPNMALLINDVIAKGAKGYYGYNAGSYGYGYGYGGRFAEEYFDKENKKGSNKRVKSFRYKED
jgi:tyrosine-protein kinase Etk/Wzc